MLADSRMERAGRTSKQSKELSASHSFTRTAAIVVVGDEILAAKVQDVNTHFLCSELRAIGWRVCKVIMLTIHRADCALPVVQLSFLTGDFHAIENVIENAKTSGDHSVRASIVVNTVW